jgi:hypothetical protein
MVAMQGARVDVPPRDRRFWTIGESEVAEHSAHIGRLSGNCRPEEQTM